MQELGVQGLMGHPFLGKKLNVQPLLGCAEGGGLPRTSELGRARWQLCRKGSAGSMALGGWDRCPGDLVSTPRRPLHSPSSLLWGFGPRPRDECPSSRGGRGEGKDSVLGLVWGALTPPNADIFVPTTQQGLPTPRERNPGEMAPTQLRESPPQEMKTTPPAVGSSERGQSHMQVASGREAKQGATAGLSDRLHSVPPRALPSRRPGNEMASVGIMPSEGSRRPGDSRTGAVYVIIRKHSGPEGAQRPAEARGLFTAPHAPGPGGTPPPPAPLSPGNTIESGS